MKGIYFSLVVGFLLFGSFPYDALTQLSNAGLYAALDRAEMDYRAARFDSALSQLEAVWSEDEIALSEVSPQTVAHFLAVRSRIASAALSAPEALDQLDSSLSRIARLAPKWELPLGPIYHAKGRLWQEQRNFPSSTEWLERGELIFNQSGSDWDSLRYVCQADLAVNRSRLGDHAEGLEQLDQALKAYQQRVKTPSLALARMYRHRGTILRNLDRRAAATDAVQQALEIHRQLVNEQHPEIATDYHNLGVFGLEQGNNRQAIHYFEASLNILRPIQGEKESRVAFIYNNLGVLHRRTGDYEQALVHFQKALQICLELFGPRHPILLNFYGNIATIYLAQKRFTEAEANTRAGLAIALEQLGPRDQSTGSLYNDLGVLALERGQYNDALEFFERALEIRREELGDAALLTAQVRINIGAAYRRKGAPQKALEVLQTGIDQTKAITGPYHPYLAEGYNFTGDVYLNLGQYGRAIEYYQQAVQARVPGYQPETPEDLPDLDLIQEEDRNLLYALQQLGTAYRQIDSRDQACLRVAQGYYDRALEIMERMQRSYSGQSARIDLLRSFGEIWKEAFDLLGQRYQLSRDPRLREQAFELAERGKSSLLDAALREASARRYAGIPDRLLEQELQLRQQLSDLRRSAFEEQRKGVAMDSTVYLEWQSQLFQRQQTYDSLIVHLEKAYPAYYELKYGRSVPRLSKVQAALEEEEWLLEYVQSAHTLHCLRISRDSVQWVQQPIDLVFDEQIREYRSFLGAPDREVGTAGIRAFADLSHSLYQQVLGPVLRRVPTHVARLTIVPDGPLGYLPFETLLEQADSTAGSYRNLPYLFKRYSVSYANSAALKYTQRPVHRQRASRLFAGFAPTFERPLEVPTIASRSGDSTVFSPLQYSASEVAAIQSILGGKAFLGAASSESQFRSAVSDYRILHFATHGFVNNTNPQYSGLALQPPTDQPGTGRTGDGFIYAYELYNLELAAQLVVLSACNTGVGELVSGEGIRSLARAFQYAGCPNLLTSLWAVDDASTQQWMVAFYSALEQGQPPQAALQSARQSFLEQSDLDHPYYWGGLVLIEHDAAKSVVKKAGLPAYLIGFLSLLLFMGGSWGLRDRF